MMNAGRHAIERALISAVNYDYAVSQVIAAASERRGAWGLRRGVARGRVCDPRCGAPVQAERSGHRNARRTAGTVSLLSAAQDRAAG